MSRKEVIVCDGCGKILEKTSQIYKIYLKTDKFWNGVDTDRNVIYLDFCYTCARDIKNTLEKIAKRMGDEQCEN